MACGENPSLGSPLGISVQEEIFCLPLGLLKSIDFFQERLTRTSIVVTLLLMSIGKTCEY